MKRLLLILCVTIGLSACAGNAAPTVETSTAPCGEITVSGNPPRPTSAKLAATSASCLAQAFRACAPKKLTIRQPETGAVREFNIVPGPSCSLQETWQQAKNLPIVSAGCKNVRAENGKLVIEGCAQFGDFTLTP